jgi:hypothetical protein
MLPRLIAASAPKANRGLRVRVQAAVDAAELRAVSVSHALEEEDRDRCAQRHRTRLDLHGGALRVDDVGRHVRLRLRRLDAARSLCTIPDMSLGL